MDVNNIQDTYISVQGTIERLTGNIIAMTQKIQQLQNLIEQHGELAIMGKDYYDACKGKTLMDPMPDEIPDKSFYQSTGDYIDIDTGEKCHSKQFQNFGTILSYMQSIQIQLDSFKQQLKDATTLSQLHLNNIKKTGYDLLGYDVEGYNSNGFNEYGQDRTERIQRSKNQIPYYSAAKKILMERDGFSEEQANQLIEKSSFEEIEAQIGIQTSMTIAITEIAKKLQYGDDKAQQLIDEALGNGDYADRINPSHSFQNKLLYYTATPNFKTLQHFKKTLPQTTLTMMTTIHDRWVSDNAEHFSKKSNQGEQYLYLPLELLGWDKAKGYFQVVQTIIEYLGETCFEEHIRQLYNQKSSKLMQKFHDMENYDSDCPIGVDELGTGIQSLKYKPWTSEIKGAMSDPTFITETLLPQLMEKGFLQDNSLMKILEGNAIFVNDLALDAEIAKLCEIRHGEQRTQQTIENAEALISCISPDEPTHEE